MDNRTVLDLVVTAVLLGLLACFIDPMAHFMPATLEHVLLVGLLVIGLIFGGLIMHESPADERETQHVMYAGRIGYLAGVAVLIAGVVTQALNGIVDIWLAAALAAMVVGKVLVLIYLRQRG